MKKVIALLLGINLVIISPVMAQDGADDFLKNTQNDILLVTAAGAGGAILGLSTLSFVDKPSKHLGNIWTGAALGVIAGVIFVAYNSAQKGSEDLQGSLDFKTHERVAWHHSHERILTLPGVHFGTQVMTWNF